MLGSSGSPCTTLFSNIQSTGVNDIFVHFANMTSDFFMGIYEGQLLGFA